MIKLYKNKLISIMILKVKIKKIKKCCLMPRKLGKIMKTNSKKFKITPILSYFYETILNDIKQRNDNISNCSECSRPTFIKEIMYSILTPNGEMISPEMSLSEKENFRQYLTEKYVRKQQM
jgi:hypothetical protein